MKSEVIEEIRECEKIQDKLYLFSGLVSCVVKRQLLAKVEVESLLLLKLVTKMLKVCLSSLPRTTCRISIVFASKQISFVHT
mmetsp:Transcript_9016/g.16249  ORF Transcript_9016/g.16249 Transcript_9016/m.16249 type:complete len:82 (-) Transcript_9016:826-1071(-)